MPDNWFQYYFARQSNNKILPDNWIYQIQSRESNTKNDVYRTSVFNRAKSKFCLDSELRIFETNFRFRFTVWWWLIFVTLKRIFSLLKVDLGITFNNSYKFRRPKWWKGSKILIFVKLVDNVHKRYYFFPTMLICTIFFVDEKYFGVTRNHAQSHDNIFFLSSNPGTRHHLSPGSW